MIGSVMKNVGRRLREDRTRLGWSVDQFAEKSGIHPTSVGNYERGERAPNAMLLLVWHDIGIDIGYVLIGVRWGTQIDATEQYLLDRFSRLDAAERPIILALVARLTGDNCEPSLDPSATTLHSPTIDYKSVPKEE